MSITFDGVNKLAILSTGTTSLTVAELWSRWVDWVGTSDNSKYPVMLSQIGGDEIGAGKYLGLTFFLENGWKIRPYEDNHNLIISGNIYSRDGSPVTVNTIGDYNVTVTLSVSNLVDAISTSGATPASIADEVWNRMAIGHTDSGTFGQMINLIKATVDLNFVGINEANAKLDIANDLVETLLKYESNRTKIDQTAKTMTVYDDDGVTPIKIFDLKNFVGSASITEVAERAPR